MYRIFILLLFFFSCSHVFGDSKSEEKHILVSIAPYKFLVEQIAGNTCKVCSIVTNNYDPHTYELSPRHMEKLFVRNYGFVWEKILRSLVKKIFPALK